MKLTFEWHVGREVSEGLKQECIDLFSRHYGVWGEAAGPQRAGKWVGFRLKQMSELMSGQDARLAVARVDGALAGYAAAVQPIVPGHGTMSWVTQLVVHAEYRKQGIAKRLLFSIWGFSDHFAWGLVTSSPYAARALEKTTRRRLSPERIAAGLPSILAGTEGVPYVKPETETLCDGESSRVNTDFAVDHSGIPQMLRDVSTTSSWTLGDLPEKWEWMAFTFRDQPQLALGAADVQEMLQMADASVSVAYSRMTMDGNHAWRRHAQPEAEFIWSEAGLSPGSRVLDVGCGDGRHLFALAKKGVSGVGLDFVDFRIASAQESADLQRYNLRFLATDARDADLSEEFDCVLCLYDVVGSYADDDENRRILRTVKKHLKQGGKALISVMNLELTKALLPAEFSVQLEPDRLLNLKASHTMESSGNIFNPEYLLLDVDSSVVYRKEQFAKGGGLPAELLVRDRRFSRSAIEAMCRDAGLDVVWSRFVQAGRWQYELDATDTGAKEILLLCTLAPT